MSEKVVETVGMGELKVSRGPSAILMAHGLGSCVGLCAYDPVARVGGLLHLMLPDSNDSVASDGNHARYANTGIVALMKEMEIKGARPDRIWFKAAGGACILLSPSASDKFRIGERNVKAVEEELTKYGTKLIAKDLGGNFGRTLEMHLDTGRVIVKAFGRGTTEL